MNSVVALNPADYRLKLQSARVCEIKNEKIRSPRGRLVNIEVSSIADTLSPIFFNIDGVIANTFEKSYR